MNEEYDPNKAQCDPMQEVMQKVRGLNPEPSFGRASMYPKGTGGNTSGQGIDAQMNALYSQIGELEEAFAWVVEKFESVLTPEPPAQEAAGLQPQPVEPVVSSKLGHRLQEIRSRMRRVTIGLIQLQERAEL